MKILAGTLLAACASIAACSTVTGVTPDCEYNVDENGIKAVDGGCQGVAPCVDAKGNAQPASACCVDSKGEPLTGDTLAACLYSYGEGPAPTTSSSSSSGGGGGSGGGMQGSGGGGS
ncbi:Hypothetical protein A7982_08878 [Minicystis rosea]|nr:Hypothetical protein A7982_08878 [Minicystis rosea]